MIKFVLVLIIITSTINLFSQHYSNCINIHEKKNSNESMLSIGGGAALSFDATSSNDGIFSFDFIPKLSNSVYLDLKLDYLEKRERFIINIIPEYKMILFNDENYILYFGAGLSLFSTLTGRSGLELAVTADGVFEYNFENHFINVQIRKPFYISESGKFDILLTINFGLKI